MSQITSLRLAGGRRVHTHRPEIATRLRNRGLASQAKLIPTCNPAICTTCQTREAATRAASPFTLVSDAAAIALALGVSSITVGPAGVVAVRRRGA